MIKTLLKHALWIALALAPVRALAVTVTADPGTMSITTDKVAHIEGDVNAKSLERFAKEMLATATMPGPRVILINSPGGSVAVGKAMLKFIYGEQAMGTKVICVVTRDAHSMAFNILSRCDVRLSDDHAIMLVHKIRVMKIDQPLTAKRMRELADEFDRDDEEFSIPNAKAMGLSPEEYSFRADAETQWTAKTLRKRGYLQGFAKVSK